MELERLQDLSIYYWLENLFSAYPQVTVVDGYPEEDVQLPSVAITDGPIRFTELEQGSKELIGSRLWQIDIATNNKAQRTEFASYILKNLRLGIPVYDYNDGFPPTVVPQIGSIKPMDIDVRPIRIMPELAESKMYFREVIVFYDEYIPA